MKFNEAQHLEVVEFSIDSRIHPFEQGVGWYNASLKNLDAFKDTSKCTGAFKMANVCFYGSPTNR